MELIEPRINLAQKIEELTQGWGDFYSQNQQETSQLKEKMDIMERQYQNLALMLERPNSNFTVKNSPSECNSMSDYIRKGNIHPNLVRKDVRRLTSEIQDGEAIAEISIGRKIISSLAPIAPIRSISSVEEISTAGLDVVTQEEGFECDWVTETSERKLTDAPKLQKQRILLHELYAQPCASQTLLDDNCIDVESWLIEQLSSSFAKKEEHSFLHGRGNRENQPEGILPNLSEQNKIEITNDHISTEDIVKLASNLDNKYQHNATFVMHKSTLFTIQTLKDESGRFLWNPKISPSMSETLLGYKVLCCEDMPKYSETRKPIVLLGDFKSAYKIVDHREIPIMRDPYSNKPFVSFYAVKRVGGAFLNKDAIVHLNTK
jgi:HK97 family phage major capsid protein